MVPKVAGKGRNFKGAGLYYLHDKKASTRQRVAFTHTENLPTRDPDKAIKCMAWTALRQQQLKTMAGGSAKGRKLAQPVYCYSLSWAPGETPSQEDMIGAAKDTLKTLGLDGHEALFIGHNDEPHPHIHVIVNRVHPETGIAAKLSNDHLKLSAWAEGYERTQGQIRCEQRVENNERRRYGEFVKDRDSQQAGEFHRWRQERERDQLRLSRDRQIEAKRQRVRDATRADWRDLFAIQRQEQGRLDTAQRNAWTRLRFFVQTHGQGFRTATPAARTQMLKGAFAALMGSQRQYTEIERKQKTERAFFADKLKARVNNLTRGIRQEHDRRLAELRDRQNRDRQDLQSRQSAQSQEQAREIREGRDEEIYRREQDAKHRQELEEAKRDIVEETPQAAKARRDSLRGQFKEAIRGETGRDDDRIARGGKKSGPQEHAPRPAEPTRDVKPPPSRSRLEKFRDEAKELTDKSAKPVARDRDSKIGLGEKFRAASKDAGKDQRETTRDPFRENKSDLTRGQDIGRERTRSIKPPGPKKSD